MISVIFHLTAPYKDSVTCTNPRSVCEGGGLTVKPALMAIFSFLKGLFVVKLWYVTRGW